MFLHVSRQIKGGTQGGAGAAPRSQGASIGEENFSFYPSRFFGCSNHQINIRWVNMRKTHLIAYAYRDPIRMRLTGLQAIEAYMPS